MAKLILMEEFHISMHVSRGLSEAESRTIHRTLDGKNIQAALRRAVEEVVRRYPSLTKTHVNLSR